MTPPTPTSPYQPYFCEENIWQLCEQGDFAEKAYAVFISNAQRTCALWSQRAAHTPGAPIVWDYHVILIDDSGPRAHVWDLDTLVGAPVAFDHWWQATFPLQGALPAQFLPSFRVIPASVYRARFSSDRSHMRTEDGTWKAPPPAWDPIFRLEEGMNLDRFIDMDADFVGEVMGPGEFCGRFQ